MYYIYLHVDCPVTSSTLERGREGGREGQWENELNRSRTHFHICIAIVGTAARQTVTQG